MKIIFTERLSDQVGEYPGITIQGEARVIACCRVSAANLHTRPEVKQAAEQKIAETIERELYGGIQLCAYKLQAAIERLVAAEGTRGTQAHIDAIDLTKEILAQLKVDTEQQKTGAGE